MIGQKGMPATWGGVERHVEELSAHLAILGHEVVVFTRPQYTPPSRTEYRGVRLRSLPRFPRSTSMRSFTARSHPSLSGPETTMSSTITPWGPPWRVPLRSYVVDAWWRPSTDRTGEVGSGDDSRAPPSSSVNGWHCTFPMQPSPSLPGLPMSTACEPADRCRRSRAVSRCVKSAT